VAEGTAEFLRHRAAHFRRLSREFNDADARQWLIELAEEYEARAHAAEDPNPPPPSSTSE
jgi:hypothetical protein